MAKPSSGFKQTTIKGTNKSDILVGGVGADRLIGGGGNDKLIAEWNDIENTPSGYLIYDGGIGVDTLDFSNLSRPDGEGIAVDLNSGHIYREQTDTYLGDLYDPQLTDRLSGAVSGVENLIGTDSDDYFVGGYGDNVFDGRGGHDYLTGRMGTNTLIGGAGDDHLFLSQQVGMNTGDGGGTVGNDIFYAFGSMAGVYSVNHITDFDLRDDASDTQFDKLFVNEQYVLDWAEEDGTLVAYQTMRNGGDPVGKIVFDGLTMAELDSIAVYSVDLLGGGIVTPQPEIFV